MLFMKRAALPVAGVLLAFLLGFILWKGGKTLDAVWLTALLAGGVAFFDRELRLAVPKTFFAGLLLLSAWTIWSFLQSSTKNYGFDEVLQTVSLTLLCLWAAAETQKRPRFSESFAQTIALALLLACAIGTLVYVLQPVNRFVGTFFDYRFHTDYWPNAWAEFVLFAWPLLLWVLWTRDAKKLPKLLRSDLIRSVVSGLVLGCLFLSYSRGGLLALAGQSALLLLLMLFLRPSFAWWRVARGGLAALVTAGIVFVGTNEIRSEFFDIESIFKKATFSAAEGKSSVSERSQFWDQAVVLLEEKPLLGHGPYSFRFIQPHLQSEVLATSDHAHNVLLKYASERGVPAAALFALLMAWALWSGLWKTARQKKKAVPVELPLVVSVAGVLAHNMIDFNLQFVGIALPVFLGAGILVSRPAWKETKSVLFIRIVACALLLVAAIEGTNLFLSSRARRAERRGDFIASLGWYSLASSSIFPRDARLSEGAMLLGLQQLPQAEDAVNRSLALNQEDARAWRLLGDIYLRWNKRPESLRAYEKAYAYGRYNDIGIVRGLVYLLKDQDRSELEERKHEFDELLNEFGLAVAANTHFIALGKNVEELVSLTALMAEAFPADADAYTALSRRVVDNANEERAKTASRPRGLLW